MTTEELIELAFETKLAELFKVAVGRVESYDANTQTASVQPVVKDMIPDGEGGYVAQKLPVIPNVPVMFQRAGGFFLSFPVQKGDAVLLIFCDRPIGAWRSTGDISEPGDHTRLHSIGNAVAIPGIFPNDSALSDAHAQNMVLGKDGGHQIHIKSSEISIGDESGGDRALTKKDLQKLASIIDLATVTPNDGGLALKNAIVAGLSTFGASADATPTTCGSAVVKIKR